MSIKTDLTVVFDLGGVLIDWSPRYVFEKLFKGRENEMEFFLSEVCNEEWNLQQDAGRSFAEATETLQKEYPQYKEEIAVFENQWEQMLNGSIEGTVEILKELKSMKTPLYALTNFSMETFPIAQRLFDFLGLFEGIVVSGKEKLIKPDAAFYNVLFDRYSILPEKAVFIDDNQDNIAAAKKLGMTAIHFTTPEVLKAKLIELSVL
ncbi:MAG: HAD family phosphatase [Alphaproteobacteria bacterium]|nr:HAD family phosphatase [Alphaproteobacteria bacterium]